MAKSFVKSIEVTSVNSNTFGDGQYHAINAAGLPHGCMIIRVTNATNSSIFVTYDGATNNDVLQPNAVLELDLQTNNSPTGHIAWLRKGTVVSAKSISGLAGVGFVYLSGYYQEV
jgi:hypothetical protein